LVHNDIQEANMGLMDILNGMQNGPRGAPAPTPGGKGSSGGMSPLTMALIGLLAYKAMKGLTGGSQPAGVPRQAPPTPLPGGTTQANAPGGGLGDLLGGLLGGGRPSATQAGMPSGGSLNDLIPGGLGGLLGGAAAGSVLSGGLGNLLKDLQGSGQGKVAQSWVGKGPNEDIEPGDLANALGADTINALSQQTGMSRDDLLAGLSQQLPQLVDQLTPDGRLPTEHEASRW
jgi:uncharacterized protein YidB (DUF937 family)